MLRSARRQRGYGLVEVTVALTLATVASAAGLKYLAWDAKNSIAKQNGQHMRPLNDAIGTYMTKYYAALINGSGVAGVANAYQPTTAELRSVGILDSNYGDKDLYGNSYRVSISRIPAGCTPANCNLQSLVWGDGPIRDKISGAPDPTRASYARDGAGADAGFSTLATPGTIHGLSDSWNTANPVGSVAGVVAMRNGSGTSAWSQFLRADGSRQQTAPQQGDFQFANNVTVAADVNSTNVYANGNVVAQGQLVSQSNITSLQGSVVSSYGNVSAQNGAVVGYNVQALTNSYGRDFWASNSVNAANNMTARRFSASDGIDAAYTISGRDLTAASSIWSGDYIAANGNIYTNSTVQAQGALITAKYLTMGVSYVNNPCPQYSIGVDVAGALLTCPGGLWKSASGSGVRVASGTGSGKGTVASAPAGTSPATHTIWLTASGWTQCSAEVNYMMNWGGTMSTSSTTLAVPNGVCDGSWSGISWMTIAIPN
jgi:hypothetical protein